MRSIATPDDELGAFVHRLDKKIDKDGRSNNDKVVLKRIQLEDRVDKFKKNLAKYKVNKLRIQEFRTLAVQGYDKQAIEQKAKQAFADKGSQLLFLDEKGNLHNSSSKELQDLFMPRGAIYSGIDLRDEIEHKVRQLLGRTELKEIASTAKVLVEISDHTSS